VIRRALFALGFRPFFLMAGLAAVLLMATWIAVLQGIVAAPAYFDRAGGAAGWHSHEMLFGYVVAVVAGFLLTSVRNWTGLSTASGAGLACLVALWLAARVTPFFVGDAFARWIAAIDLAFLPVLAVSIAIPLVRRGQLRNFVFVLVLVVLAAANLLIHLQALGITSTTAWLGTYAAADLIVVLISIIAGRVFPFFTRAALPGSEPRSWRALDIPHWRRSVTPCVSEPGTTAGSGRSLCCGCCFSATHGSWPDSR
jgi:uncharacterized protein involved in response to NO